MECEIVHSSACVCLRQHKRPTILITYNWTCIVTVFYWWWFAFTMCNALSLQIDLLSWSLNCWRQNSCGYNYEGTVKYIMWCLKFEDVVWFDCCKNNENDNVSDCMYMFDVRISASILLSFSHGAVIFDW